MKKKTELSAEAEAKAEFEASLITPAQALSILAPHKEGNKQRVHTFEGFALGIIGCDIDLSQIKKLFKICDKEDIALAGENMRRIGHAVAVRRMTSTSNEKRWMFIETDKTKADALYSEKGI